jgi:hypothetical protein
VKAAGHRYERPEDWGVPLWDDERAAQIQRAYRDRERVH